MMRMLMLTLTLCLGCATTHYVQDPTIDRELAAAETDCRERCTSLPEIVLFDCRDNLRSVAHFNEIMYKSCMAARGYREVLSHP
jgi:hypothetical protein